MDAQESTASPRAVLPVIRGVFRDAQPTVDGRERVMQQLNRRVHEHPDYQKLTQRVKMFLAGYIHRCLEEWYDTDEHRQVLSSSALLVPPRDPRESPMNETARSTSPILSRAEWLTLAADCEDSHMRRVAELAAQIAELMEQPIGITVAEDAAFGPLEERPGE